MSRFACVAAVTIGLALAAWWLLMSVAQLLAGLTAFRPWDRDDFER